MTLEDLRQRIGEDIGTSEWFTLDQRRIDTFADCTEDHHYLHVNPVLAEETAFGTTIAHGFLSLAMLAPMVDSAQARPDVALSLNHGFDRLRFVTPVRTGKRVRGHFRLLDLAEKRPGEWVQKLAVTVEIEGEEHPALLAEWLLHHRIREAADGLGSAA